MAGYRRFVARHIAKIASHHKAHKQHFLKVFHVIRRHPGAYKAGYRPSRAAAPKSLPRIGVGTAAPAKVFHVHATTAPSGDLARFSCDGNFNIQYMSGGKNFQFTHQGDNVFLYQQGTEVAKFTTDGLYASKALIVPANAPSSSADSSGVQHEIRVDDSYIYVKMSDGNWGRVAHSTW